MTPQDKPESENVACRHRFNGTDRCVYCGAPFKTLESECNYETIKQLRAKVEELEKRNCLLRRALEKCRFVNPDSDKTIDEQLKDNERLWFEALSIAPVKGWCRTSELHNAIVLLEDIHYNFSNTMDASWLDSIKEECTRLQALINK
jgi:hypothetical protein